MVDSSLRKLPAPFRRRPTLMDCESLSLVTHPGCYGNCINIGLGSCFNVEGVINIGYTMKPRGLRDLDTRGNLYINTRARSARVFMVSVGPEGFIV